MNNPRKLINEKFLKPGNIYEVRHFDSPHLKLAEVQNKWPHFNENVLHVAGCSVNIRRLLINKCEIYNAWIAVLVYKNRLSREYLRKLRTAYWASDLEATLRVWRYYFPQTLEVTFADEPDPHTSSEALRMEPQTFLLLSKPMVFQIGPISPSETTRFVLSPGEEKKIYHHYECRVLYRGVPAFIYGETGVDPELIFHRR